VNGVVRRRDISWQRSEIEELRSAVASARLSRETGSHHIVVVGPKGGSGKTTTAAMLATTLATSRGDIVCVLDATHQLGTLRRRLVPSSEPSTRPFQELCTRAIAQDLSAEWAALAPYVDVVGSLRVLRSLSSSGSDLSPEEFTAGVALLRRAAQIVVSDIGTKANGPLAVAAFESADTLVIATELAYDALELTIELVSALAGESLSYRLDPDDWSRVCDGRYARLVASAVVAVSPSRQRAADRETVDQNLLAMLEWLRVVCGVVVLIDGDDHLSTGEVIEQPKVGVESVVAYLRVASTVASRFSKAEVA
jgi:MinD-like ATPase involved in chromosome partitioning or flagellar assembly